MSSRIRGLGALAEPLIRSWSGRLGIAVVILYTILGLVGPQVMRYDPFTSYDMADAYAVPEWYASIFSPSTPRNIYATYTSWEASYSTKGGASVEISRRSDGSLVVVFRGSGEAYVSLLSKDLVSYPYDPAKSMLIRYEYTVSPLGQGGGMPWYNVSMYLYNPDLVGRYRNITQGGVSITVPSWYYVFHDAAASQAVQLYRLVNSQGSFNASIRLPNYLLNLRQPYKLPDFVNPVSEMLLERGTRIGVGVNITYYCNPQDFVMRCGSDGMSVAVKPVGLRIYGLAYGLLGTSYLGADVWAQFVYGARSAIIFGFSVAAAIILIGLMVGVTAGYRGGRLSDYSLTFLTDVVYFLPALPLILAVGAVFGRQILLIYLIIVLLSWPGTARIVRSWTLALRNEVYVEAAQALGAGTWRILRKHIIPQLVPLLVYALVLDVPGAIFTEFALQLIGFGDPNWPSWGRTLNEAYFGGAIIKGAWWWIMPPILGVTSIAVGFALIGMALDEVVNPRLRRR